MQTIGSDVETLKDMIGRLRAQLDPLEAALRAMTGESATVQPVSPLPQNGNMEIRPDTFDRMKLKDAVEKYFFLNGGKPAHRTLEILPALQAGGADLGDSKRQDRHLKIAIRMNANKGNKSTFLYDDRTELVQLRHPLKMSKTA